MTLRDRTDEHVAIAWFVAGFHVASPDWASPGENCETPALTAIERHREGRCIACARVDVVLMDGFLCERCYPDVPEMMEELH